MGSANEWKYEEREKKELKMAVRFEEWVTSVIHRNKRGKEDHLESVDKEKLVWICCSGNANAISL